MNKNEIEQLTLKILYAEKVISPPVDAERIAEISYDLEIDVLKLKNTDDLASIDFNHKKIILNEIHEDKFNKNLGLRNFTIAHEMGHWFLHKNLPQENLFDEDTLGVKDYKIERQADYFATCLLMPEKFVRAEFKKLTNNKLLKIRFFLKSAVEIMAKKFCVSKQAMEIRLSNELKLIYIDKNRNFYLSEKEFLEESGQQKLF